MAFYKVQQSPLLLLFWIDKCFRNGNSHFDKSMDFVREVDKGGTPKIGPQQFNFNSESF
jgi:hypothetical protein